MFYADLKHNVKNKTNPNGKKAPTSRNGFFYITRTAHFQNGKEGEEVEWVKSGNMPDYAKNDPKKFWTNADKYEQEKGRTSSVLTIALPNNISKQQRIELVQKFIDEFANKHGFAFTCAIHNHRGSIEGKDQPHLHFMYSERPTLGNEQMHPAKFFARHNTKNPERGGIKKLSADVLGHGKNHIDHIRKTTETLINDYLERHAPTKKITIKGTEIEVPSFVSCLSNRTYNKINGTKLKDVEQLPRWKVQDPKYANEIADKLEKIKEIREHNNYELYGKYYEAELQRRAEVKRQKELAEAAETRRAAEVSATPQVPAVQVQTQKPHFSGEHNETKFGETYDMTALERVCRFNDDVRKVLKTPMLNSWKLRNQDFNYGIPAYVGDPNTSAIIYNVNGSKISLDSELRSSYEKHCLNVLNALETHYSNKIDVFNKSFSMNISKFDLDTLIEYTNQHDTAIKQLLESIDRYSDESKNEVFTHHLVKIEEKQSNIEKIFVQAQEYKSSHAVQVQHTQMKQNKRENDNTRGLEW